MANVPDCYCITCDREIHHLGIMSHRAMHRRREEYCKIQFSGGNVIAYHFNLSREEFRAKIQASEQSRHA